MIKAYRIKVPSSWDEVTLEQYIKYSKVEGEGVFMQHKAIQIFCNIDLQDVGKMKHKDVTGIYKILADMLSSDTAEFTQRFDYMGKEYGFIPNFTEMTAGEYLDLTDYLKEGASELHRVAAILFRPVVYTRKDKYLIEAYESADKYAHIMLGLPASYVLGALTFFFGTLEHLMIGLQIYLKDQANSPQLKNLSKKDMDLYIQSINSLDLILPKSMQSLVSQLNNFT